MKPALAQALHESRGYLQDSGWHQTAQLVTLAAHEIERLTERVRELEASEPAYGQAANDPAPATIPLASVSRRTR